MLRPTLARTSPSKGPTSDPWREARPTSLLPPPMRSTVHPTGRASLLEEYCRAIMANDRVLAGDDAEGGSAGEHATDVDGLCGLASARAPSWSELPTLRPRA